MGSEYLIYEDKILTDYHSFKNSLSSRHSRVNNAKQLCKDESIKRVCSAVKNKKNINQF